MQNTVFCIRFCLKICVHFMWTGKNKMRDRLTLIGNATRVAMIGRWSALLQVFLCSEISKHPFVDGGLISITSIQCKTRQTPSMGQMCNVETAKMKKSEKETIHSVNKTKSTQKLANVNAFWLENWPFSYAPAWTSFSSKLAWSLAKIKFKSLQL